MRIVSLVPSATEMLFAIGARRGGRGRHAPVRLPAARSPELPRVTRDLIGPRPGGARDRREVRALHRARGSRSTRSTRSARRAAAGADLTQSLCAVCAVSSDDVRAVAERIDSHPRGVTRPADAGRGPRRRATLAPATDREDEADELLEDAASAHRPRAAGGARGDAPARVAALEWLDPVFVAGHWTPQLIDFAGGERRPRQPRRALRAVDLGGGRGRPARLVVVMPCGYDADRARDEAYTYSDELGELGARESSRSTPRRYYLRPGPRLLDGPRAARAHHPSRPHAAGAWPGARVLVV